MNAHQKATIGNFLIKKTMGLYYKVPEDFDQLVYMGLVLQGVGAVSYTHLGRDGRIHGVACSSGTTREYRKRSRGYA